MPLSVDDRSGRLPRCAVVLFGASLIAACAQEAPSNPPPSGSGGSKSTGTAGGGSGGSQSVGSGGFGATGGSVGTGGAPATGTGGTSSAGGSGSGGVAPGTGGSATGGARAGGSGGAAGGPGGASGAAGRGAGGTGGTAGAGAGAAGGGAGLGGPSLCGSGKYIICENFESTAVGAVPTGWAKHGNAVVADDQAARGTHALKMSPEVSGERRIYTTDSTKLGTGHWGRVFYRVETPAPVSCDTNTVLHSTFVGLQGIGSVGGAGEYRVVDTVENLQGFHQFLYNVQYSGREIGLGSSYSYKTYDGSWHCAEWHIDNPSQTFTFYIDGGTPVQLKGSDPYDVPASFSQLRIGLYNYQKACAPYLTAWIDEIALDTNRIGCEN
jgi:hypothetical protein